MSMKLILIPLSILIVFGLLSAMGLGSSNVYGGSLWGYSASGGWWDASGHQVLDENRTAVGEAGEMAHILAGKPYRYVWLNVTTFGTGGLGIYNTAPSYPLYNTPNGYDAPAGATISGDFSLTNGLGLIAIVGLLCGVAVLASLKIFGSGTSEIGADAVFKTTGYVTLWCFFSALSYNIWANISISFLVWFYFLLTTIYAIGIINSVGSPQGGD